MTGLNETGHEDRLTLQLASDLRELIDGLPVGSLFSVPPSADICYCLELFLPRVLRQRYPEWENESLDGVFVARAIKTGATTAEFMGTCILISDQTVTPFLVELDTEGAASGSSVTVLRLMLGEPGAGPLGISGPACNTREAQRLLASLVDRIGDVAWSYAFNGKS